MRADHPLRVALWQFINQYARTIGGDPTTCVGSRARELAVVKIERTIEKIVDHEVTASRASIDEALNSGDGTYKP